MIRTQISLSEDEYVTAKREAQDLTMTDAVGLHVMRTQRIPVCWSTDFHLAITGVPLLVDQP